MIFKKKFISILVVCILMSVAGAIIVIRYAIPKRSFVLSKGKPKGPVAIAKKSHVGEKITYEVRMGKLRVGTANFEHLKPQLIDGLEQNVLTVQTSVIRFKDTEKIFFHPETYLPIRVERKIRMLIGSENIVEKYNQDQHTLTITKSKNGSESEQVIKKGAVIHNAILLPYHLREIPDLHVGWEMNVNLPTREIKVKLVRIEDVKVPCGTFKAYYLESDPKQVSIWISADTRRIPLKIEGSGIVGYTLFLKDTNIL